MVVWDCCYWTTADKENLKTLESLKKTLEKVDANKFKDSAKELVR